MAAIAGYGGKVMVGANVVAEIEEWGLDIGAESLETTNFSSNGWKEFIAGLKEWSGSFSGNWDMSDLNGQKALQDALLGGTPVALYLYVNDTNYYSGTALIEGEAPKAAVGGKVEVEFNFKGTGSLSYT